MHHFVPHDFTLTERLLIFAGPLFRWSTKGIREGFAAGEALPVHPSAMIAEPNATFNLILPRFFSRITIDEEGIERVKAAASGATVIYVARYVGQLEYNYFGHLFVERHLPLASYCNALTVRRWMKWTALKRSIAAQEVEIEHHGRPLDPLTDDMLSWMIAEGKSVMLRIPQVDLEEESVIYSAPLKGLKAIVEAQRKSAKPIVIVPVDFLWSRRPPKAKRSLADILFGEKEQPGRIRKSVLFWRNYKRAAQASLGVPLSVHRLIEDNPEASDEELTRLLRQELKATLRLQRRKITGPAIRPRQDIIREVISDEALDEAICRIATASKKPVDDVRDLALRYTREIVADLDYTYFELFERLLGKTLVKLFESFNVDTEGLTRAKELFQKGPVVFVPNHKSHADYLILSYVLYHNGMNAPHIAAGKNLSFWPLGRIFRRCGAFFIRRSFRGNDLYADVLRTYLKVLLKEGHSQEFFIEGGRSRTGKLRTPRTGMIRMLERAAREGNVANMSYIPVSITYDRVIEHRSYMKELGGGQKDEERTSHLIRLAQFVSRKKASYGSIYIRFGEPIPGAQAGDAAPEAEKLAQSICHEINRHIVVTPAAVAAAALLGSAARGVAYPKFRQSAQALLACLTAKGVEIPPMLAEMSLKVLQDAVANLAQQKLLTMHDGSLEPFISVDESKRVPLSFFRNGIVHFLVSTGVIARLIRWHAVAGRTPDVDEIAGDLAGSKALLFREFRFATGRTLADHVRANVNFLASQGAIALAPSGRIAITPQGSSTLNLFEAQVLPAVERIWIAARVVLERMSAPEEEKAFMDDLMRCGNDMYLLGKARFRETVTKDGFTNAVKTLADFGLLKIEHQKPGMKNKRTYTPTRNEEAAVRLKVELEKLI
jgi:glycerol-3-phosphate O-acyltransferase